MADPICLQNIASQPPPLNRECPTICGDTDFINGTHCGTLGVPTNTPILTKDPNFGGTGVAGYCYCCCSCFTLGVPIEVPAPANQFQLIENLQQGDDVLATGFDLQWQPAKVFHQSGPLNKRIIPGLWHVRYRLPGERETRDLIVTPDHLFLLHEQRKLKAVQFITPNDGLTAKNGGRADVVFVVRCENVDTAVHSLLMEGDFDGNDPTGHLVNANGVVTADYVVQTYYERARQPSSTFGTTETDLIAGTPEYARQYPSAVLQDYLNDPSQWPKGVLPVVPSETISPPPEAFSYLTAGQAGDLIKSARFLDNWNTSSQVTLNRLFKEHRAYFPETICLLDRDNLTPNVYAWSRAGQKIVLFTGAFARIQGLFRESYSLVLAVMQAHLNGTTSVANADCEAVAYLLREKYDGPQYASLMTAALEQLNGLFATFSPETRGGGTDKGATLPSTDIRLRIYDDAISFRRPSLR